MVSIGKRRRHVDPFGVVVVQQTPPGWFDTVTPSEREHDGIRLVVSSVRRDEPRLDVVVDRLVVRAGDRSRLNDSIETALKTADGIVEVVRYGGQPDDRTVGSLNGIGVECEMARGHYSSEAHRRACGPRARAFEASAY